MNDNLYPLTRKKAVALVLAVAVILALLVLIRWFFENRAGCDLSTSAGRLEYIYSLGWSADADSEQTKGVILPLKLSGVMLQYNRLQLSQGFDLEQHLGEACSIYTYKLAEYPEYDSEVYITLYIQGKTIIAGDIHASAYDGFMHGIYREM